MKNIKIKNLSKIRIAMLAISVLLLNSCLKDKGPVEDFSKSPALVGFQFKGSAATPMVTSVLPLADAVVNVEVTLSASSLTLSNTVTATVAADQASLDAYNSANGTSYTLAPTADYTIDGGGAVTISPGQQIVNMVVHVNSNIMDFTVSPAFAFKITAATGATIATNLNVIIMPLKLRNLYEGSYNVTGYFVHPAAPRSIGLTKYLSTVTAIRSESFLGDLGNLIDFDVDGSNNLVNMTSDIGFPNGFITGVDNAVGDPNYPGPPYVYTTYNNTYDPANHTFWMHYGYRGAYPAFSREVYEKWVLQ
ncbi:MAG: DUF1735 domain-containing protein [Chitinophagales bacterium]